MLTIVCVFHFYLANFTGVAFVYTRQNVTYRYQNVTTIVDDVETQELVLVKVLPYSTTCLCAVI